MTSADLDDMAALLGDPRVMLYPATKSRDDGARWIARNEDNYATHGFDLWIMETHSGQFVGDCGLTGQDVDGVPMLEVGYHVRTVLQGQGCATEAAAACRDFARTEIDAPELVAIIHPDNTASENVAQKIGMTRREDDHGGLIAARTVLGMTL
ncbi:RimJ/RimL family protein N-acetyltransferase [Microbacterium immunditiarum]|uniref:RimJ/RimL family protein N-acetyltransferase n=2 Tax=Microbacterium immunditiarum TaxID=337480 RepID=A0A7Y9GR25_9MICO|nr:RimJ/RimL family protein N-acetyltransferase [Microbacterium immunditiarum]